MAYTTMHFAVGMAVAGAGMAVGCTIARRGWRWLPPVMTIGGAWALVPDLPRIWREDFPSLPFASTLGAKSLERGLHTWGDLFFFHRQLDLQPREFALHGMIGMLLLYNLAMVLLMWMHRRERDRADDALRQVHHAGARHAALLRDDDAPSILPEIVQPVLPLDEDDDRSPVLHTIRPTDAAPMPRSDTPGPAAPPPRDMLNI